MNKELEQAIADLKRKQEQYLAANETFEPVAYHELRAAQERVNVLIKEAKEE